MTAEERVTALASLWHDRGERHVRDVVEWYKPWSELTGLERAIEIDAVRDLLEVLGFDPKNPPESGAVGKARDALIAEQCRCREYRRLERPGCQECPVVETCRVLIALKLLGGE